MTQISDADKVFRNDTGKNIVSSLEGIKSALQGVPIKTLSYTFNLSQGGAWLDTSIDMTNVDMVMFERVDSDNITMQTLLKNKGIEFFFENITIF